MSKTRLEAFSDGVIAILITVMVLALAAPREASVAALRPLLPVFGSYVLSFVFIAIYWNNHHHLFQASQHVNGLVLWANTHLLFWLSLVPFVTAWMGQTGFAAVPMAAYGVVLLMCAVAYTFLVLALVGLHGRDSTLARAMQRNDKGNASLVCYFLAIPLAFVSPWISGGLYVIVALLWLAPDPRIEKQLLP